MRLLFKNSRLILKVFEFVVCCVLFRLLPAPPAIRPQPRFSFDFLMISISLKGERDSVVTGEVTFAGRTHQIADDALRLHHYMIGLLLLTRFLVNMSDRLSRATHVAQGN